MLSALPPIRDQFRQRLLNGERIDASLILSEHPELESHPETAAAPRQRTAEEEAERRNQQDRARVEAAAAAAAREARVLSAKEEAVESEAAAGEVTVEPEVRGSDTTGVDAAATAPDQPAHVEASTEESN